MANTLTISVSDQDISDLDQNPSWSATKIFRSAMKLQRSMELFFEIYDIWDFKLKISTMEDKILILQKEIVRRQERIDSLQDVLANKELTERRLRKTEQTNNGYPSTIAEAEREDRIIGDKSQELEGISQ